MESQVTEFGGSGAAGTDHTGVAIDVEDVQGFLENGLDAGRFQRLECEETELMEDSREPGLDSGILIQGP